ncbi:MULTISPECIES: DUF4190 domain-containing protein [Bacillaceae]|uniref:DUF4190 domain-containing protein n=1 Tax=Bacillaceae TaxID=186817 RepID=UPI001BDE09F8|nr:MULTISPECIES: DUF4190 domain-containing protein [Bacillaceae]MDX8359572.1 DUF4190 domain-containing protein [Cytobacillus sp. IB215316]
MAQERNDDGYRDNYRNDPEADFMEETSTEFAEPIQALGSTREVESNWVGWLSLALSIISLFVAPILFGAAGIILGFVARRRGAEGMGAWAIGIGIVSIVLGIFILPFF